MNHVLIIGGGIIGLTTALELRNRGLAVTLTEKGTLPSRGGDGASGAAGGMLSPPRPWRNDPAVTELCTLSLSLYPRLLNELQDESVRLIESGLLCLIPNGAETREAEEWAATWRQRCEPLDDVALQREEPALNAGDSGGVLLPDVCRVEPHALLAALVRTAQHRGVKLRTNCTVQKVRIEQGRMTGADTDVGFIAADVVVVCAGAWATSLLPPTAGIEIRPIRGQMIEYIAEPGLLHHIVSHKTSGADGESAWRYLIPCGRGRILVGSTFENRGFDNSTTEEARAALSGFAVELLPALTDCPVSRQWAGLRPCPTRAAPLIGAHPEVGGLFINGGHCRNGFALAPASALLTAQLICEEKTRINARAFEVKV